MTKMKKSKMTHTDKKKLFKALKKWTEADYEMSKIAEKYDEKAIEELKCEAKR